MITKLLLIKNCGKFKNCNGKYKNWDGTFSKINTIYAGNGTGKTTFTQILKSLSGSDKNTLLLKEKKDNASIEISIMYDNNKKITFNGKDWGTAIKDIVVYDHYYAEKNNFIIIDTDNAKTTYELTEDEEKSLDEFEKQIQQYTDEMVDKQKKVIEELTTNLPNDLDKDILNLPKIFQRYSSLCNDNKAYRALLNKQYGNFIERTKFYLNKFNKSLDIKNYYLSMSCDWDLNVQEQLCLEISIENDIIGYGSNSKVPHILSEGDKSTLSICSFLAKIDMFNDLQNKIIVVDDPFTSLDTQRRTLTISHLSRIASKCKQFFLLSHDINFIKDFDNYCIDNNKQHLKIEYVEGSSRFLYQDLKLETLTGLNKDLYILQNYIKNGCADDLQRRNVAGCMRKVIEGIFRIKYNDIVSEKEWLGDFLGKIRDCDDNSYLARLKGNIYETLSDINIYSSPFHHSNSNMLEVPIDDSELRIYVEQTLDIIHVI